MSLEKKSVAGIEALRELLKELSARRTFVYFTGSHVDGKSWCPDCVASDPVVSRVLEEKAVQDLDAVFVSCHVGLRDYWKDPRCPFRTESDLKLNCIPSLIEYNTNARIIDAEVIDEKTVLKFLTAKH
ncbi:unnamed protein product [Auanema sp. JU1783]|nr:unnamed protein product [Auanema sp. JU1783]